MRPLFVTLIVALAAVAGAETLTSTAADRSAVAVTVYNDGTGLVREERDLELPGGVHELRFADVASELQPETVSVRVLEGRGVTVLEQNYEYDLLSPGKLLEKFVGETLTLVRFALESETTVEREVTGRLLSANEGTVWEIDGRIVTNPSYDRIVFPRVPENLIPRPTLLWLVEGAGSGARRLEAAYLTRGLSWKADYVLTLGDDDSRAGLQGWVTIDNRSGAGYEQALLKLVAGDVNRVAPQQPRPRTMEMKMAGAPAAMEQEAFFEYHLYSLPRPTTLKQNQTKQVQLLDAQAVAVEKRYELRGSGGYYRSQWQVADPREKVQVFLSFRNDAASGLGQPLPKGIVRVYKRDRSGSPQFAGEDRIDHTPKDEDVRLRLGNAFDVTAERRQTEFDRIADRVTESAYEVAIRNHKETAVEVEVIESLGGDWTMIDSSLPFEKTSAYEARFRVPVPADGETVLRYRVRTQF